MTDRPVWVFGTGMPAAPRGPWRPMAAEEEPKVTEEVPADLSPRDHAVFPGAVAPEHPPGPGRAVFRATGPRYGGYRDREAAGASAGTVADSPHPASAVPERPRHQRTKELITVFSMAATGALRPVTVEAEPDRPLSGWLWPVKWILLVPHFVVVAFLAGGGGDGGGMEEQWFWSAGLIMVLALFATIAKAFTGICPRGLFDLLVGLNRRVLRVTAHAALMTDAHPPFRLDQGGGEPEPAP